MPTSTLPPAPFVARFRAARRIVVLAGAGMAAESGIPAYRDRGTGFWARFAPHTLATPEAFDRDPETVWAWYEWRRHCAARAVPHAGYVALRAIAARTNVESVTIVTQNVDTPHERANATDVLHLHGSLFAPRCSSCRLAFESPTKAFELPANDGVTRVAPPHCRRCEGRVRPGVVWFGESLPEAVWLDALRRVERADPLLVVGTSGVVYPAASLPDAARRQGCDVAVINPDLATLSCHSSMDWQAHAAVGLPALLAAIGSAEDAIDIPLKTPRVSNSSPSPSSHRSPCSNSTFAPASRRWSTIPRTHPGS